MIKWLYKWLPRIFGCHCMDSRSFWYKGVKFPICARCTGELIGIIFSLITFAFIHTNIVISAGFLLPLIFDGFLQSLTSYESNNIKRLLTGIFFGYGFFTLFLMSISATVKLGYYFGSIILDGN